ncbi:hypothetical protein RND71_018516 [Anisodus tanguticus]|uniref:Uncharacterized protein n=1 Tax=Anisodus tanguticus TaxID=243964 RepID=A0AAE1S4J8_9SOLA|nr:hypothetical protein RND71_018516 [Anisodus tanguticus]
MIGQDLVVHWELMRGEQVYTPPSWEERPCYHLEDPARNMMVDQGYENSRWKIAGFESTNRQSYQGFA